MWLSNDKILKREISFLPANFLLLFFSLLLPFKAEHLYIVIVNSFVTFLCS